MSLTQEKYKQLFNVTLCSPNGDCLEQDELLSVTLALGLSRYINSSLHRKIKQDHEFVNYTNFLRYASLT